ncbi:MAG: methyltransferase domain-containing protein, partial [Thermoleophilia bacterium]|nr:methyltransferase domain-containing protein [Thermoleophilia bacterium]
IGLADIACIHIGYRLGLYERLLEVGPATSAQLASAADVDERYAREWLEQQAVTGILEVRDDAKPAEVREYVLPPGAERVLVDRDSPLFLAPAARAAVGSLKPLPALIESFRTGKGVAYPDYGADTREGIAEVNRAMFINDMASWLGQVEEVDARLSSADGARVADIGCGSGWSSISIARAYPHVTVDAFDVDQASVELARVNVEAEGLGDRVRPLIQDAGDGTLTGRYDLVTIFEALHDMARPVEALRSAKELLIEGGCTIVADERVAERFAAPGDELERFMYGWSVLHCLAVGKHDHEHSAETGTVMRPSTLERYATEAGYSSVEVLPIENDFWRFYRLRPE